MENKNTNLRNFYEKMKIQGILYLPAECRTLKCYPVFEEKDGEYRMKLTDDSEWLTEVPCLNIADVYECCEKSFDTEEIKNILKSYVSDWQQAAQEENKEQIRLAELMEEFPKEKIFWRLVPANENIERCKLYPGRICGTGYLVYAVLLDGERKGRIRAAAITNAMITKWGRKEPALYETAERNTQTLFPYDFEEFKTSEKNQAFIIGNEQHYFGLGTLLYREGPLKELAMELKKDVLVYPLSVHEAVAFPADGGIEKRDILRLLKELSPFDGEVWYYNRNLNKIAFTEGERAEYEAVLKHGLLDAAERRIMDGIIR